MGYKSNFNATMGIGSAHARNIRNQEGSGNSGQRDKKKENGTNQTKKLLHPRAYPLKILGVGYFRQDVPKWDKF
jgi:hypothetical protein